MTAAIFPCFETVIAAVFAFPIDITGKTYAEMTDEEKNHLSHRKLAFERLKPIIDMYYGL